MAKKTSSALEFWRNVYVCRVADEEKFSKQFIMDFAKVTKKIVTFATINDT